MSTSKPSSSASSSPPTTEDVRGSSFSTPSRSNWLDHVDLVGAAFLAVVALVAALSLEARGMLRVVLVAPLVLAVPGYLLIQAVMGPGSQLRRRPVHAVFGLGVTPAVLGLLGLLAALFLPGGFVPVTVMVTVTVFCVICAGVAATRRVLAARSPSAAAPTE